MNLVQVDRPATGITVLRLADEPRRNALSAEMAGAFRSALDRLPDEPDLRAVVVTGRPPVFSAGGDLAMIEAQAREAAEDPGKAADDVLDFYSAFLGVRSLPVPVIAAVNGHAVGAGLCLALACDIRVVAAEARLGANFAWLGLHPGMGCTWLLPRVIGAQRAAEMLFTGKLFRGEELAATGLAVRTCPAERVLTESIELAGSIAQCAPQVIRHIKTALIHSPDNALDAQLRREADAQVASLRSPDLAEGLAALKEKRDPRFVTARAGETTASYQN